MRSLAGTLFSFLLLFGITEYEIVAARTSQVKPQNPSPI